ncbi:MAG TPA: hypothetical protein VGA04_13250 [Streptosporangiaceae bacterium]
MAELAWPAIRLRVRSLAARTRKILDASHAGPKPANMASSAARTVHAV